MTTPSSILSMSTATPSSFLPSASPHCQTRTVKPRSHSSSFRTIRASSSSSSAAVNHDVDEEEKNRTTTPPPSTITDLLRLTPATLTVLSSSLAAAAPAFAAAKVEKRKRSSSKSKRTSQFLSVDEFLQWSSGLPAVYDRIPHTDLLRLREQGLLKHIVKHPFSNASFHSSMPILAILNDSRVVRTVLPPSTWDAKFWHSWDSLRMDELCTNAYTPPLKPSFPSPYLRVLDIVSHLSAALLPSLSRFVSSLTAMEAPRKSKSSSKQGLELDRLKAQIESARKSELRKFRKEKEAMEMSVQEDKRIKEMRRRQAARRARVEKFQGDVQRTMINSEKMRGVWLRLAKDDRVTISLAWVIFGVFYWLVVYNYKRNKKDYEDRLKIQQAEAEDEEMVRKLQLEEGLGIGGDEEGEGQPDYLKMAQNFMRSGARVKRARGKKQVSRYMDEKNDARFSDCAGLGKIRDELEEIVKFFTERELYERRGIKTPGGILLCGAPGVGKTLLAKAVAGEAGVNFLSISASQFVEIYVGVGASRVRALYQEAKLNAPSIIFIDELDAVGRTRGLIAGSGGQERDATLNQLLVCLDGFQGRGDVVTIAATNRPDILDPALVRPGRFDRKIVIPRPGFIGRLEIIKVHALNKTIADDIDYEEIANKTEGMVGAELANVVEMAAIRMMRDERSEITTDDFLQAIQVEDRGLLEKKEKSLDMWKRVALLEGSLAVAAANFPELKNVEFITISPRSGRELGYVRIKRDRMKFWTGMLSRQFLLDYITLQLAPRAADAICHGEDKLSTIWSPAADNARSAARTFVFRGLSEKNHGLSQFWSVDLNDEIDLEATRVLDACYARAKEIVQRNQLLLDALVDRLVEKKSVTKQEFFNLVNEHGQLEASPISLMDVRKEKLLEFQEGSEKKMQ